MVTLGSAWRLPFPGAGGLQLAATAISATAVTVLHTKGTKDRYLTEFTTSTAPFLHDRRTRCRGAVSMSPAGGVQPTPPVRNVRMAATMAVKSLQPNVSAVECIAHIGQPTSTTWTPRLAAVIGPIVVPHAMSCRTT